MEKWKEALKPFDILTKELGGDRYITMSCVLYRISEAVKQLEPKKKVTEEKSLRECFAEALRLRFEPWAVRALLDF